MTSVLFKSVLVLLVLFIIYNLGRALFILVKGDNSVPMSRFLGRRVALSGLVILLLLIAMAMGWVVPHPRPF